jgi:DNA invertase Pin-like site-specific DNA recombinase
MNGKRVGLYLRVSTDDQTVENQRAALIEAIEQRGWHVVEEFADNGISGAKGREKRPRFDALLKAVTQRKIDIVAAWSVDRLGRSLQHLIAFLGELDAVGCDLYLHQQAIDTTTPAGRAMFQMLGVFAEFERAMIRERVKAGQARARIHGTKSGKPIGQQPMAQDRVKEIRAELARGTGIVKTARLHATGVSVVQRIKREVSAETSQQPEPLGAAPLTAAEQRAILAFVGKRSARSQGRLPRMPAFTHGSVFETIAKLEGRTPKDVEQAAERAGIKLNPRGTS